MSITLANWNGQIMPLREVMVPACDRAFLLGDAVYEVVRVYQSRPWKIDEHLERLKDSLESIKITAVDLGVVKKNCLETLSASGISEAIIYMQISRGEARRTHRFPTRCTPNVLIYVEEFADPYKDLRQCGVRAITYPDIRWGRNEIKATSLLANCLAAEAAAEAGCAEAILIDNKNLVTEGSHTSVFAVRSGKLLVSPAAPNILPGITKRQVLSLCSQSNIETIEGRLAKDDLWTCDEVFVTGTPEEILPVVNIDGKPIAGGKVGPIALQLQDNFNSTLSMWLKARVAQ